MNPTEEQLRVMVAFEGGSSLAVEALAGTGKTSTMVLCAAMGDQARRKGQYVAFNRAIVDEAGRKLPETCRASTAHSLAARSVGRPFLHRLKAPRMRSFELARLMGIGGIKLGERSLSAGWCASAVMRALRDFSFSDDHAPGPQHIAYVQGLDVAGQATATGDEGAGGGNSAVTGSAPGGPRSEPVPQAPPPNHALLCEHLAPWLDKAWADLCDPQGRLPYSHDHYLKLWQLSGAAIPADYILVDEAQDMSPVMIDILAQQDHAQMVYVGDTQQTLYEWRGCRNALGAFRADDRLALTGSFRFGPAIAERANDVLESLDTALRLAGLGGPSRLERLDRPDAILCRSNAGALVNVIRELAAGRQPLLLGGVGELIAFCRAALQLQESRPTDHPDLGCFHSWADVQQYVLEDPQGGDLSLLVRLVDRYGAREIIEALDAAERAAEHDVVVATTHKAKGRQWPTVRLHDDFARAEMGPEEWRCLYVGVTRAMTILDDGGVR